MPYYPKAKYAFVRFERSHLPAKKYNAVLRNRATGRETRVPFGARAYAQYKDRVPLRLYATTATKSGGRATSPATPATRTSRTARRGSA